MSKRGWEGGSCIGLVGLNISRSRVDLFVLGFCLQGKPKKDAMSIEEAIDDSENLTDFILDFDEEE